MKPNTTAMLAMSLCTLFGCQSVRSLEYLGKIYYLDGAGNWGITAINVKQGLIDAGYEGDIESFTWTTSYNPLIDQWNIPAAKQKASELSRRIETYRRQYPESPIHVIAHSAGTGVAIWAIEQLDRRTHIDNLILLGSSLSHDYDMSRALQHIRGRVYVYHSPDDLVLASVRVIGTIDGKRGIESAGLIGLRTSPDFPGKIVNTPWAKPWSQLGWHGGHTDCTNRHFIRHEVARHLSTDSDTLLHAVTDHPVHTRNVFLVAYPR